MKPRTWRRAAWVLVGTGLLGGSVLLILQRRPEALMILPDDRVEFTLIQRRSRELPGGNG